MTLINSFVMIYALERRLMQLRIMMSLCCKLNVWIPLWWSTLESIRVYTVECSYDNVLFIAFVIEACILTPVRLGEFLVLYLKA